MQKSALAILDAPLNPSSDAFDLLVGLGIKNPSVCDSIMLAMALRAERGDVEAARFLRDTSGQREVRQLSSAGITLEEDIRRLNLRELSDEELYALVEAHEAETAESDAEAANG